MSMRNRAVAMMTAVVLGAGGTGIALAPSANAAPAYFGIDGRGAVANDWEDEENLGVDAYARGNAIALWETVLWADGAQWEDDEGEWQPFRKSQIDGSFGPETESATQWWQDRHNLPETDGTVVSESWDFAQTRLQGQPGNIVQYKGLVRNVNFKRVSGKYQVKLKNVGPWKYAHYRTLG
ncbi:peptidoglycan-binding domain-containing protein [Streptomyces paradoxus]|uniref:peptidoglycan-binding domain-containing protein n=1 Tax=Streptomyces paradoxus TaxID=66375 RepID=UPI00382D474E